VDEDNLINGDASLLSNLLLQIVNGVETIGDDRQSRPGESLHKELHIYY
jgi:hypothetical protein